MAAIAACEQAAQSRWRERLDLYHDSLLTALSGPARARYEAAQQAWERFRTAESALIDATLGERDPPAGAALAEGAKTQLLQRRAEQLADHLNAAQAANEQ